MKETILVAGLGLIGGSLAKAINENRGYHLIGYDQCKETIDYAIKQQIIDSAGSNFKQLALQADIIILAAPISETIELMKKLNTVPFTKDVIVTDVASVKGSIIKEAQELSNEHIKFIGGHPMAGSHKNGIQASRKHLFENAVYILIPTNHHMEKELDKVKTILQPTNSHFIVLKPKEHDEMTSVISHFPHLIASSLVHQAKKWEDKHAFLPELAAGGFRDITRIASSNPKMWEDIFYHNRGQMIHLLDEWIQEMKRMKDILKEEAKSKMIHYLKQAKDYRDGLESSKRGALPSYYDLHVDIEDRPGALLAVLQILAEAKISLTNVQILEIREGLTGVLRLSVATKEAQEKSYQLLTEHNYFVTIKE